MRIISITKYTFKGLGASVSDAHFPGHSSRQVFAAMFAYLNVKTERAELTFQSLKSGSWYGVKMLQKKNPHVDLTGLSCFILSGPLNQQGSGSVTFLFLEAKDQHPPTGFT